MLILGGQVIDGSGAEPFAADVAVTEGRIAAIGDVGGWTAARTIRADGHYVTPGFVDMHTHSERGLYLPELAPSLPYLTQGVTTVVGGADGYGSWPLHETMDIHAARLERQGIGTNAVLMVGAGQARRLVMGMAARSPTADELSAMQACVREAMASGAWGLSTGLEYPPGLHADTAEIIALASEAAYGGMYHTHMRSEGDGLIEAVAEAIEIAERSEAVGVLTHLKVLHRRNWGKAGRALELIEAARDRGVRVYADQFPFADAEVPLIPDSARPSIETAAEERGAKLAAALNAIPDAALLDLYAEMAALPSLEPDRRRFLESRPGLLREMIAGALGRAMPVEGRGLMELAAWYGVHRGPGNPEERARFIQRLEDPDEGARIRSLVAENLAQFGGAAHITIVEAARSELESLSLAEAADAMGVTVIEAAIRLGLEGARAMADILSREDLERIMRRDFVATGSDGDYPYFGAGIDPMGIAQHIRTYASFTTKLRRYAIDRGVISLPHAIRSFTGLPAEILGWSDRGLIEAGYWADITVFDPASLAPRSTARHPHRYSEGVRYVLVNGKVTVDEGWPVGVNAGRVLRIQDR